MKIRVTADDIRLGSVDGRPLTHCAVARAIRRHFPKSDIVVGFSTLVIGCKGGKLQPEIANKIRAIVYGEPVKPFVFTLPRLKQK